MMMMINDDDKKMKKKKKSEFLREFRRMVLARWNCIRTWLESRSNVVTTA